MRYNRPIVPNLRCIAFPVSPPTPIPAPAPPPSPKPAKFDSCIPVDICGNILILDDENKCIELWSLSGSLNALATISIFNSESSTSPITVEIKSKINHTISVLPGNTSSYTSKDIRSVKILLSSQQPIYLEGKYCINGKIFGDINN